MSLRGFVVLVLFSPNESDFSGRFELSVRCCERGVAAAEARGWVRHDQARAARVVLSGWPASMSDDALIMACHWCGSDITLGQFRTLAV